MARKSKKTPVVETTMEQAHIKGELFYRYVAAFYQFDAAQKSLDMASMELRLMAADPKFAPLLKAIAARDAAAREALNTREAVASVGKEVCDQQKIPYEEWKNYAVDTTTGMLRKVDGN